jgi:N-methylhydantoinase A
MMMKKMRLNRCIIPRVPGNHSALGLISSDIKHDYVQSVVKRTSALDIDWVNEIYQSLEERGKKALRDEQVQDKDIFVERGCDMRYVGQAYVPCIIPFASESPKERQLAETEKNFHRIHQELYKHVAEAEPTELVSLRVRVVGKQEKPPLRAIRGGKVKPQSVRRNVYFEDVDAFVECDSYMRDELPVGFSFNGPAIIFQSDSTSLIYTSQSASVDGYGNIIIKEKVEPK